MKSGGCGRGGANGSDICPSFWRRRKVTTLHQILYEDLKIPPQSDGSTSGWSGDVVVEKPGHLSPVQVGSESRGGSQKEATGNSNNRFDFSLTWTLLGRSYCVRENFFQPPKLGKIKVAKAVRGPAFSL